MLRGRILHAGTAMDDSRCEVRNPVGPATQFVSDQRDDRFFLQRTFGSRSELNFRTFGYSLHTRVWKVIEYHQDGIQAHGATELSASNWWYSVTLTTCRGWENRLQPMSKGRGLPIHAY